MQVYCRLEFPQRITWLAVRPLLFCNLANMHCTVRLVLAEPKFVSYKRLDACICSICGLVVSLQCLVDRCHGFGYGSLNALARDGLRRRCLGSLGCIIAVPLFRGCLQSPWSHLVATVKSSKLFVAKWCANLPHPLHLYGGTLLQLAADYPLLHPGTQTAQNIGGSHRISGYGTGAGVSSEHARPTGWHVSSRVANQWQKGCTLLRIA